jgi:hypothetical protein
MTTHQFAHKIKPLWKALTDIESMALEIHVGGDTNAKALHISQIARDVRSRFSADEQEIADRLVGRIKQEMA